MNLPACLVIVALLVAACAEKPSDEIPFTRDKYRTWEAPTEFERGYGTRNIAFVDDDRVLYLARPNGPHAEFQLTLWTLSTGDIRIIGPAVGELCYFRGYLTYWERMDLNEVVVHTGTVDGTKAETLQRNEARRRGERHRLTCKYYRPEDFAPQASCKLPLLPGDGYIETQGGRCAPEVQQRLKEARRIDNQKSPPGYEEQRRIDIELLARPVGYVDGNGNRIALPIETAELDGVASDYTYLEWANRYALPQHRIKGDYGIEVGKWPVEEFAVYLLSRTGAVDRIVMPWKKAFFSRPARVIVTKVGIAAIVPGFLPRPERTIGVMFARNGRLEQIDDGDVQHWALSPNGCRIAIDSRKNGTTRSERTLMRLRVIDVCGGAT